MFMNKWMLSFLFVFSLCFAEELGPIQKVLHQFKRPFTFLIIAHDPSVFLPIAESYNSSTFVFLNPEIPPLSYYPPNIVYLKRFCNIEELQHLSESEHFDIVYVNDHRSNILTNRYKDVLANLGEHIFLSFSSYEEAKLLNIEEKNFRSCLADYPLYYMYRPIHFMRRTHWFEPATDENHVRQILSNFQEKVLYKNYGKHPCLSAWLPGINLITFKMLNGTIPNQDQLKNEINQLFMVPHRDWMPNNMIVQGIHLSLIDFHDPDIDNVYRAIKTPKLLELTHQFVSETELSHVYVNFEKLLIYTKNQFAHKRR